MPTHYTGSAAEVLALNTFIKFQRAGEALGSRLTHCHTLGELTISQFSALEALYHLGPLRQNEIGAKMLRSAGNMTLVIDNLEKAGLVTRTRATDDRRAIVVALTSQGQQVIAAVLPRHIAAITQQLSVLTAEEQQQLGALCKKLGTTRPVETR